MRLGIASGHSANTEGERLWEWRRCRAVEQCLVDLLRQAGHEVVLPTQAIYQLDNDSALWRKIRFFNERRVDIAIELHLNAGRGDYSTCLYWDDEEGYFSEQGKQLAVEIAEQFKTAFPWRALGAKGQTYFERALAFLHKTNMPATITECAFKDDPSQRAYMETKQGAVLYATSVFQGICRYADGLKVA